MIEIFNDNLNDLSYNKYDKWNLNYMDLSKKKIILKVKNQICT